MERNQKNILLFSVLVLLLGLVFLLQLLIGSVSIPMSEVMTILSGRVIENEAWRNIILESRLPGAIAAILAGAGLSVSGLQMQTMFRNPVAGPYVLGISSGASLGVAVYLLAASVFGMEAHFYLMSSWGIIIAAAIGSFSIFFVVGFITYRLNDVVAILIVGLMIGGGISAFIEILQSYSASEALKSYVLWTFGSFRYVDLFQIIYLALIVVFGIAFSLALSKPLNIMLLGDAYAYNSGLDVFKIRFLLVLCTSLLAGCITAFCGPIGFVGLAVPHLARRVFYTFDHRILIPASALMGGIICCVCNILASSPGTDSALPVNAVTALFGAPVVIWIILKRRKG